MFRFPRLTPFVKKLLIGLGGAFILFAVTDNWLGLGLVQLLALVPSDPGIQTLWQPFTYFVVTPPAPNALLGFLVTLLFLWLILAPFEERFGSKRTMQLTLVAILSASIPALVVGILAPGLGGALYGPGPLMMAAIAAFAYSLPRDGVLSFFGILPMKPMHLIYLVLALSAVSFLLSRNVLALVADVGAVFGGIGFIRWMRRPRTPKKKPSRPARRKDSPFTVIPGGSDGDEKPRWLN